MIQPENLYMPDKYKVILGNGESVGFCTVWNEPDKVIEKCPDLLKKSAIIGTLYSRQGVNIILRNLALNPQIRHLYMWDNGALSCSPFGISGKEIIFKIWKNGINADGEIPETDFKLEKEIDVAVVNQMIKGVSLKVVSDEDIVKIVQDIVDTKEGPYMQPVRFPDNIPLAADMFPSEKVGFIIHGKTVLDAWIRVLDRVMRYGATKGTQYGSKQRELIGVTWVVESEDPDKPHMDVDWPEGLRNTIGLNTDSINHYRSVFLSADMPEGVAYTYGSRLMKYPNGDKTINEIEEVIIKELKDSVDTRRAVATTMVPSIDKDSKEPPCITQIQVLQTNKKMHLLVTVRSHDIFKAAIPNAFGLRALQQKIAKEVDLDMGYLQITSQSAHIYEAEWEDAKKLVSCAIWERPPADSFDPALHADPRGMFLLSVKEGKIIAHFKSPSGDDLLTISGKTAREVYLKIAQLELVNRPDHLLDIGAELQKAEIAISQNLSYTQDKPLPFANTNKATAEANVCVDC